MCDLFKINKVSIPLRPSYNSRGSAYHPLNTFLVDIINPLTEKNSKQWNEFESPTHNNQMVSFNVVSLFTRFPLNGSLLVVLNGLEFDSPYLSNVFALRQINWWKSWLYTDNILPTRIGNIPARGRFGYEFDVITSNGDHIYWTLRGNSFRNETTKANRMAEIHNDTFIFGSHQKLCKYCWTMWTR